MVITRLVVCAVLAAVASLTSRLEAQAPPPPYFPPAGTWETRSPAALGMDPTALAEAIRFAQGRDSTRAMDFSDQERIFGTLLGSVPTRRAATNGLVIYKGYVVATFGDPASVDPTYSVAKSLLATVAGVAVREGRLMVDAPVGRTVRDGGYDSPRNAQVTWKMHLQQESEWEGELWGKSHDFIGRAAFGEGARSPRSLQPPGTFYEYNDVRINRFALSLLRTFGRPVPDVFRTHVMDPIGASSSWKWVPYVNSYVDVDGVRMASVSGGTRWGGGMWIDAWDLARVGYLWLREGRWGDRQIVPTAFVKEALTPSAHGPDYGYLWWLNTKGANLPGLPRTAYSARGAGGNTITVSPEHDLVVVLRWQQGNEAEVVQKVIAAIR